MVVMLGASVLSSNTVSPHVFGTDEIQGEAMRTEGLPIEIDRSLESQRSLSERQMSILHCLMRGESNKLNRSEVWHC